jgi:tight adherence protein C
MSPMTFMAAGLSALAFGLVARELVRPPKRLRSRVEPYLSPTLDALGPKPSGGPLRSIFGPMAQDVANWVGALIDRSGPETTLLRLRQAGWFQGLREEQMEGAYRLAQLRSLGAGVLIAVAVGQLVGGSVLMRLVLVGLGAVAGGSRTRGRLQKAIEQRRERMKIEIYTVNQLLAMRVRAGGGVIHAVQATVQRGAGEVIGELKEALRLHRSGWRASDAFRRIAELSPEPFCSRTYRLLASAEERGSDLASALLALSEDVRETRRESIKRTATRRRAAMLLPTIAILAPVLILFVAAPLPYLITGWQ